MDQGPIPYLVYQATIAGESALWATRADQAGTARRLSPRGEAEMPQKIEVLGSSQDGILTFLVYGPGGDARPYAVDVRSDQLAVEQARDLSDATEYRLSLDGEYLLAWSARRFGVYRVQLDAGPQAASIGPIDAELDDAIGGLGAHGFFYRTKDGGTWRLAADSGATLLPGFALTPRPTWLDDGRAVHFPDPSSEDIRLSSVESAIIETIPLHPDTMAVEFVAAHSARLWVRVAGVSEGVYARYLTRRSLASSWPRT